MSKSARISMLFGICKKWNVESLKYKHFDKKGNFSHFFYTNTNSNMENCIMYSIHKFNYVFVCSSKALCINTFKTYPHYICLSVEMQYEKTKKL